MKTITRIGMIAAAGASLALSSCSTGGKSPSGFLSNYAQLNAGYGMENAVSSYLNPDANFKKYDSVIIESVTTVVATPGISPAVTEQLAAYLGIAVHGQLSSGMKIVSTPSPTTLRVRTALTDVIEGRTGGKPVTTVHQAPQITLSGSLGSADIANFVSRVSFEGEILDSVTGDRLLGLVDHRLGVKRAATPTTSWTSVRSALNVSVGKLHARFKTVGMR